MASTRFALRRSTSDKSRVVSRSEGMDAESNRLLQHVFADGTSSSSGARSDLDLHKLPAYLDAKLEPAPTASRNQESLQCEELGRIGPEQVLFDISGNSGTLIIEADRLGVASHSNFSTIRANVCVYKGKWLYELMLGSKGVMQLGWCTLGCRFSQEEGVGDTNDSYAYDGNRLRKWNVKTHKYGEAWLTGDVITCAIDCSNGTITFCRNGRTMGEAFNTLRLGPGIAYFPAISLSLGENLRANFGATPLRYPLDGFRPLHDPPGPDLVKAKQLFGYLEKLLPAMVQEDQAKTPTSQQDSRHIGAVTAEFRSRKASLLLMASHVFDRLSPLLKNSYIVESCLLRFMLKFCDSKAALAEQPYVLKVLDLLWELLQEQQELKPCLENLVVSLLSSYRFSPVTPDFSYQQMYLTLTLSILRHPVTRKYLLNNILFDKVKFPIFMHVKPPDDTGLEEIIPQVWWGFRKPSKEEERPEKWPEKRKEEDILREQYYASCEDLRQRVAALEKIQVEILKELLNNTDTEKGASTRSIFLKKFRAFLRENSSVSRTHLVNQCPLPVSLCFFHRLIQAVRFFWDAWEAAHPEHGLSSSEAYVPCKHFCDDSINYYETQRLGGLLSHLKKAYKDELHIVQGSSHEERSSMGIFQSDHSIFPDSLLDRLSLGDSHKKPPRGEADPNEDIYPNSLVEIVDGIVLLYSIAAHKQLGKMCSLRDTVNEYVSALEDTKKKKVPTATLR